MASAEGGSVSSGMAYGEGCPLSSRLSGLGERRELPQRGPGRRKRILAYFEGHGQSSRYTATTQHRIRAVQTTSKDISFWRDCSALVTFCL